MASILTNNSALAALSTLRSINSEMETTQARISTGKKVETASDNAAYWSIATTMKSDKGALSTVQDSMGLGASKVDTAYAGIETAIEIVDQIKKKLVTAQESTADKSKIQNEIKELQGQLKSVADSASFNGENWLKADINDGAGNEAAVTKQIVGSFTRDDLGNVSVQMIDVKLDASTVLFDTGSTDATLKRGILDQVNKIAAEPSVTLEINTSGKIEQKAVKSYTLEDISKLKDIAFSSDGKLASIITPAKAAVTEVKDSNGNVTTPGSAAVDASTIDYVQVKDGVWVQAKKSDKVGEQETTLKVVTKPATSPTANDEKASYYTVDVTKVASAAKTLDYSLSTIDITSTSFKGANKAEEKTNLDNMITFVSQQYEKMTKAASTLGSTSMRIELQSKFVDKLSTSIEKGIGRLVDADMNEESTRLKALQTQQQLGVQALTIANSESQNILSLFR